MPKECGLKAQIREAVVEVMAEERAEEAKYDKHSKFVRDYLSIEAAKRQIKPLSADDVRKKLGIKPSEVDYDLSDVPVAQMVEELRMRKDVAAKRIGNGEYVNVQFSNLPSVDIVNNSFGITGPAEVIVISYEKGDDE